MNARLQVEADHYFTRRYDDPKRFASYWHQIDLVLSHDPKRVLEIGPGNGFLSGYLRRAGVDVTTIDIDANLGPTAIAALPHLPFPDSSFDAVIAFEVLEHIPWELFTPSLREMARVSAGAVGVSLPDKERVLRLESSMGKLWSFRFLLRVPRLVAPRHKFKDQHYWEIGKRGYRQGFILKTMRDAGLDVARHWRVFENPTHHFFDLRKR